MLKYALLATSLCIAAPALAQETAPDAQPASPVSELAEPAAPAQDATPAQPTTSKPATTQDQIAQVVASEFPTYDKNSDGALDETEFGAWMVTLRKAAQPAFVAESAEGKAWVSAAFRKADVDSSKTVNAVELTGFLTPKTAA